MKKNCKVFKIGISKKRNQKIEAINEAEVLLGKGIPGDRHFHDNNSYQLKDKGFLTLIYKIHETYQSMEIFIIYIENSKRYYGRKRHNN